MPAMMIFFWSKGCVGFRMLCTRMRPDHVYSTSVLMQEMAYHYGLIMEIDQLLMYGSLVDMCVDYYECLSPKSW